MFAHGWQSNRTRRRGPGRWSHSRQQAPPSLNVWRRVKRIICFHFSVVWALFSRHRLLFWHVIFLNRFFLLISSSLSQRFSKQIAIFWFNIFLLGNGPVALCCELMWKWSRVRRCSFGAPLQIQPLVFCCYQGFKVSSCSENKMDKKKKKSTAVAGDISDSFFSLRQDLKCFSLADKVFSLSYRLPAMNSG